MVQTGQIKFGRIGISKLPPSAPGTDDQSLQIAELFSESGRVENGRIVRMLGVRIANQTADEKQLVVVVGKFSNEQV